MPIIYTTPSGTGTLSPPDLLDIENIYSPTAGSLELISQNDITLSPLANLILAGDSIIANSTTTIDLTSSNTMNLNCISELNLNSQGDTSVQGVNTYLSASTLIGLNCITGALNMVGNTVSLQGLTTLVLESPSIVIIGQLNFQGQTTAQILAIVTPPLGSIVYNSTLNQLFYYQHSPITGLVLGWYNSTGNIKL